MGDLFVFAAKLASELFVDPTKLGESLGRLLQHVEENSKFLS